MYILCVHNLLSIQIHNGHSNNDGCLQDYCDGLNCRNHPLFSVRKDSLQLLFYYDDVEICNPLGPKQTIHKLGTPNECSPIRSHSKTSICFTGLFYFVLGNLSPMYRSRLSSIQLVIVVENKFIKKYGMNAVLEPFVTDVGKLVSAVCVYFCARITINVKNTAGRRIHFPSTWMPAETTW